MEGGQCGQDLASVLGQFTPNAFPVGYLPRLLALSVIFPPALVLVDDFASIAFFEYQLILCRFLVWCANFDGTEFSLFPRSKKRNPDLFPFHDKSHAESKFKRISEAYSCMLFGNYSDSFIFRMTE
ncbi:hypothetical protein L6164_010352 [Bauhinia variegata]|uniref:Uncharacterized protein n=1 Tax=Bauhinia variegata TaxID=167791 RepID=A0ACB9PM00_BAUVA|nr:hypothetical protein L6164_010352 [Bauhinia variegata]